MEVSSIFLIFIQFSRSSGDANSVPGYGNGLDENKWCSVSSGRCYQGWGNITASCFQKTKSGEGVNISYLNNIFLYRLGYSVGCFGRFAIFKKRNVKMNQIIIILAQISSIFPTQNSLECEEETVSCAGLLKFLNRMTSPFCRIHLEKAGGKLICTVLLQFLGKMAFALHRCRLKGYCVKLGSFLCTSASKRTHQSIDPSMEDKVRFQEEPVGNLNHPRGSLGMESYI